MNRKARVIALYLPQYHPIPENDKWWGKGFTEWRNVACARPLFRGHYQPHIPADLGFYDLRLDKIREEQARMAQGAGIEGFCYWHYWFGKGKKILEGPFQEVLESGKPNFPFCLGWANHSWTSKTWEKGKALVKDSILLRQTYDESEYIDHFYDVLPAFKDVRYITVDGNPIFLIFNPFEIPDISRFLDVWRKLAQQNGINNIHFVGITHTMRLKSLVDNQGKFRVPTYNDAFMYYKYLIDNGFDAVNFRGQMRAEMILKGKYHRFLKRALSKYLHWDFVEKHKQSDINNVLYVEEDKLENVYPTMLSNWDRSPRSGKKAVVYTESTPAEFKINVMKCLKLVENKEPEHRVIFLKSWNEWGEGNHVEPDLLYGTGYLDVLKECLIDDL